MTALLPAPGDVIRGHALKTAIRILDARRGGAGEGLPAVVLGADRDERDGAGGAIEWARDGARQSALVGTPGIAVVEHAARGELPARVVELGHGIGDGPASSARALNEMRDERSGSVSAAAGRVGLVV